MKSTAQKDKYRNLIDRQLLARPVNKMLHGFPSPMYWHDMSGKLDPALLFNGKQEIDVYVGIAFCPKTEPDRCGFCLFPTVEYDGQNGLGQYLDYVEREVELIRPHTNGRRVRSVFFGGGTPNLIKSDGYSRLMNIVRRAMNGDIPQDIEVTLEGIPPLFNRDKLNAIKEAGINRISIGVQQLDDELIKLCGRQQNNKQVVDTLVHCKKIGLKSSIDLIYGWPRQTMQSMLAGLELAVSFDIKHLSHYELNVGGPTDFAMNRQDELPSIATVREMARASAQFLESNGYKRLTPYDWQKIDHDESKDGAEFQDDGRLVFEEAYFQRPGFSDILGIGYAAISTFLGTPEKPGLMYVNHRKLGEYYASIDAGKLPVERGFAFKEDELKLHWLFRRLETLSVSRRTYFDLFQSDLVANFEAVWEILAERQWVKISDDRIDLIGDGLYVVPIIQTVLAADTYERLQKGFRQPSLRVLQN